MDKVLELLREGYTTRDILHRLEEVDGRYHSPFYNALYTQLVPCRKLLELWLVDNDTLDLQHLGAIVYPYYGIHNVRVSAWRLWKQGVLEPVARGVYKKVQG